jgi:hypothetical protein
MGRSELGSGAKIDQMMATLTVAIRSPRRRAGMCRRGPMITLNAAPQCA